MGTILTKQFSPLIRCWNSCYQPMTNTVEPDKISLRRLTGELTGAQTKVANIHRRFRRPVEGFVRLQTYPQTLVFGICQNDTPGQARLRRYLSRVVWLAQYTHTFAK